VRTYGKLAKFSETDGNRAAHSLWKGIGVSLALHACGLTALNFLQPGWERAPLAEPPGQAPHVEVYFTRMNPQAPSPMPSAGLDDSGAFLESPDSNNEYSINERRDTGADSIPRVLASGLESATGERGIEAPAPGLDREADGESTGSDAPQRLSAAALRASIATALQEQRSDLVTEWLAECERYRNRRGTRECPDEDPTGFSVHAEERAAAEALFASLTRPADNDRRAAALQRELDFLRSLDADNETAREVVAARAGLQLQKYRYLTGAENEAYAAFQAATTPVSDAVRHDGSVAILSLGGPAMLSAIVAFANRDSPIARGTGPGVTFTEYTPPKRDDENPQDEDEPRPFEIRPPLFPVKR